MLYRGKVVPALQRSPNDWTIIDLFSTVKQGLSVDGFFRAVIIFSPHFWFVEHTIIYFWFHINIYFAVIYCPTYLNSDFVCVSNQIQSPHAQCLPPEIGVTDCVGRDLARVFLVVLL